MPSDPATDKLVEVLHDEIDGEEELREKARQIVESKAGAIMNLLDATGDINEALAALAASVEDELTDLTTEAVHYGRDAYLRRKDVD